MLFIYVYSASTSYFTAIKMIHFIITNWELGVYILSNDDA